MGTLIYSGSFSMPYAEYPAPLWTPAGTFSIRNDSRVWLDHQLYSTELGYVLFDSQRKCFVLVEDKEGITRLTEIARLFGVAGDLAYGIEVYKGHIRRAQVMPCEAKLEVYQISGSRFNARAKCGRFGCSITYSTRSGDECERAFVGDFLIGKIDALTTTIDRYKNEDDEVVPSLLIQLTRIHTQWVLKSLKVNYYDN